MAITKTYINSTDYSNLATWMQNNLAHDYFTAVLYDSGTIICKNGDDTVLTVANNSITAYKSSETAITKTYSGQMTAKYACMCTNGALITLPKAGAVGGGELIITKNNNNVTTIVFSISSNDTYRNTAISVVAWGDSTENTTLSFNLVTGNQTQFVPFVNDAVYGTVGYTPEAFYIPMSQRRYSDPDKLLMNGKEYLSDGYWAIKDADVE